ncbi:hypothetical protein K456DRAFT_51739 [Colletotrichum gloeosporioides 23]|nr:hypothetical protein K456DRAFT_51739 [Colletotrichum gloeosporioides 23]
MSDWRHESTIMDKVYSAAFCNISASTAPDAHHSLFNDPKTEAYTWQIVQLKRQGKHSVYRIVDEDMWRTDVDGALVNSRAWVLQERLLSRRILHFGERQLLWECRENNAAEFYPEDVPWALQCHVNASPRRLASLDDARWPLSKSDPIRSHVLRVWKDIVMAYSGCKLTFPADRMVALSAIAKQVAQILGDKYVAGMWHRSLKHEILWSVESVAPISACQESSYRAPSWSWAAADAPVTPAIWDVFPTESFVDVEDYHLDYVTEEFTGLLKGGWIRLWGALKPLHLTRGRKFHKLAWEAIINTTKYQTRSVYLDTLHQDFELQNTQSSLYCIPSAVEETQGFKILLLEVQDRSKGIFRRIGMITHLDEGSREQILGPCDDEQNFPCEEYRNGKHLIRII